MNVAHTEGNGRGPRRQGRSDPSGQGAPESQRALPLTVGGLFSGIGGIELGLQRAGMQILWHAEADEFCQHVLSERWPGVPCFPDVRGLVADASCIGRREGSGLIGGLRPPKRSEGQGAVPVPVPYVDVLCGGFPCQDISLAGRGAGIEGSRSGLWVEFARLIGELRPRYVVIENVAALLARGLDRVLADLAARGFDAEWDCLPASAVGAPHRRDRIWIVAYPHRDELRQQSGWRCGEGGPGPAFVGVDGSAQPVADAESARLEGQRPHAGQPQVAEPRDGRSLADAAHIGHERAGLARNGRTGPPYGGGGSLADHWAVEPDVGRVAHGVPARVDRLRALGNAVVPQVAEWVGRRILAWEQSVMPIQEAA